MGNLKASELKNFLDQKVEEYNRPSFIESDPIQIPHLFTLKQDIEISGLLTATIAWGQRKTIISNARKMMALMDDSPYEFILGHSHKDLNSFQSFVHRTFNGIDLIFFVKALRRAYNQHHSLEALFLPQPDEQNLKGGIERFRDFFLLVEHEKRSQKHISSPTKNSAAKRLVMYLRWMVRPNNTGVDFGIWKEIPLRKLSCPLDVHSGNVARKLGLLQRKQNDWKAVEELDQSIRKMDIKDPSKYDFALFGLGAFEGF